MKSISHDSHQDLDTFLDAYILERDISEGYVELLRFSVRSLQEFAGRKLLVGDLNSSLVNSWVKNQKETGGISDRTIKSRLSYIRAIWTQAYEQRATEARPERLVRVRVDRKIPVAWSAEDVAKIVLSARQERFWFERTGISRAAFWETFVRTAYDTMLRLGDLLDLKLEDFDERGVVRLVQHKTRNGHYPRVRPETFAMIKALHPWTPSRGGVVFYCLFSRENLWQHLRTIIQRAGLSTRNQMVQRLRRSGATAAEAANPGSAWRLLGHRSPGLDRAHYIDPTLLPDMMPLPPDLPIDAA